MMDEAKARAVLKEMRERLAQGPYAALGIPSHATARDIRAAFLQLTKIYHPARFGRMASDLQKLSNEVFLALRAAHDQLAKVKPTDRITTSRSTPNGMRPSDAANGSTARGPQPAPIASPAPQAAPPTSAGTRAKTTSIAPPAAAPRARTPSQAPTQPAMPRRSRSSTGWPRVSGVVPTTRPISAGARSGPLPMPEAPTSARTSGPIPVELVAIYELIQRAQWDQARVALGQLVTQTPSSTKYRALLIFIRGREAQLAGRLSEARIDLHEALQLDPELHLAKAALAELFTRRK